jgi:hypothetical protein
MCILLVLLFAYALSKQKISIGIKNIDQKFCIFLTGASGAPIKAKMMSLLKMPQNKIYKFI